MPAALRVRGALSDFASLWAEAALTTLGFFWMAFWAFCLGYAISSGIQVFVTRERMRRQMGDSGLRAVSLGAFFGFVSSSCSFAALSTTRALFQKGAGLVPSLAFLLASTNLVVELGILIFVFLSWQFVVGEYLGGFLLIGLTWLLVRLTLPAGLARAAREHAGEAAADRDAPPDWRRLIRSREGWRRVGRRYLMEWQMVWKDVTFGFTIAGIIAVFVPVEVFRSIFPGSEQAGAGPAQVVLQALVGPLAAFFTFIGSMGNIPLAAVLFGSGVSFAGVMAFIFSDLVVFPVLRISARYFGPAMAFYVLGVFLVSLVATSILLHYGFELLGAMPDAAQAATRQIRPAERFQIDTTSLLNLAFGLASLALGWLARSEPGQGRRGKGSAVDRILLGLACLSLAWLAGGVLIWSLG